MIKTKDTIKSCLKGDRQAFAMLVNHYKSFVCSLAYCTSGSIEESEDIARSVFITLWQNLSAVCETGSFNSKLAGITLTTATAFANREKTPPAYTSAEAEEMIKFTPIPTDPADAAIANEERLIMWQTIKSLPLECREMLIVYHRYERSLKQTAELLSITESVASQRLAQAKQMLGEKTERRVEATIRNTAPDERFTAMIIAAVSTIPAGITAAKATGILSSPAAFLSSATGKIAASAVIILILAALLTTGRQAPPQQQQADITLTPPSQITETALPQAPKNRQLNQTPTPVMKPAVREETVTDADDEEPILMFEGVLSGLVMDIETDSPVANATISITLPDGSVSSTNTSEYGYYTFDTLDAYGKCSLTVAAKEYIGVNCAYGNVIFLELDADTHTIQHIELQKACMLEIEVTDDIGTPIAGAVVEMINSLNPPPQNCVNPNQGQTDTDGKLLISGIKPSNNNYILRISPPQNECYIARVMTIALSHPNGIEKCQIALSRGCSIEGYLYDNNGAPRTGVRLSVSNSPAESGEDVRNFAHAVTDEFGYYRFECVPEQELFIKTESRDDAMGISRIFVFPNKIEPTILNIGGGSFLSGRLFAGSEPLVNCKLTIIDSIDLNQAAFISSSRTDEYGSFTFSGIPQGKKMLICEYENRHIVIAEIETFSQDLNLGDMLLDFSDAEINQPEDYRQ